MYECFKNNIYILYFPAHASHVLQPLDLSIFSPIKAAYRRYMGQLVRLTDSSPIGKRGFLICYIRARIEGLTIQNIKSGWRATGLWPISLRKPLLSPLLVDKKKATALPKASGAKDPFNNEPLSVLNFNG